MSRTHRESNFILSGIKSLHLAEYTEPHALTSPNRLMKCMKCGRVLSKKRIIIHFAIGHKDIYNTITTLAKRWALISSTETDDIEEGEEDMPLITNS